MKVELRIDPGCGGVSVVINAPALTDEVKALAARLVHFQFEHQICHVFPVRGIFLPVSDYLQIVIISGF